MNIYTAEVHSNFDPERAGNFYAFIDGFGSEEPLPVIYVSPYMPGTQGILKPPALPAQTQILVCQVKGFFYYMGCIGTVPNDGPEGGNPLLSVEQPGAVAWDRAELEKQGNGRDNSFVIQNDMGYGIEFAQTLGPTISAYSKMYTPGGKRVILNDHPNVDSITLDTGKGSKLMLTGDPVGSQTLPYAGLYVDTELSQRFLNRGGKTSIVVDDGTELNIINRSSGLKQCPDVAAPGNVNIQSAKGDVNLTSQEGNIFVECAPLIPGGEITVRTDSTGKITLEAGNVHINAQSISFATNNFDVLANGSINFQAGGSINFRSGGNINADGATINLNSGSAGGANTSNTPGLPPSKYPLGIPYSTM